MGLGGVNRFPPVSELGLNPDTFVAITTFDRISGFFSSHVPMYSSVRPGFHPSAEDGTGYISAVSMKLIPRVFTA